MPKGGARVRSGPAPDPEALVRDRDGDEWVDLPADGRDAPVPAWPLVDQTEREADLWAELWRLPQAFMWERQKQFLEVALYVRRLTEAEVAGSKTTLGTLVRQMSDSLGLTTPGLRAARWKIVQSASSASRPAAASGRASLRVVGGAAGD